MAVNTCHIASPVSNELRRAFERWAREQGLQAYDQRSGAGFLATWWCARAATPASCWRCS
jgi:hypothetical protein